MNVVERRLQLGLEWGNNMH